LYSTLEDLQADVDAWLKETAASFRKILLRENADANLFR